MFLLKFYKWLLLWLCMGFLDSFYLVENPEVLAVALGVLAFVIVFAVLTKLRPTGPRGVYFIASFAIGGLVWWTLYKERFYGGENLLAILLYIFVGAVVLAIFWSFIKSFRGR